MSIKLPPVFNNFPNLKSLSLVSIGFWDDKHAIRLLWGCALLQELTLVGCLFKSLVDVLVKFPGKNLKFLKMLGLSRFHEVALSFPNLERVVYSGRPLRVGVDTLSCLCNAELNFTMPPPGEDGGLVEHRTSEILAGLRNVVRLTLEGLCIEFLTRDLELFTRLPASYCGLNHLKLDLYPDKNQVQVVMLLLRRFHNLRSLCISIKTLTLTNMAKMRGHQDSQESSTEDALKHLKKVEIKYFGGSKSELDLVQFLLENGSQMLEMNIIYSKHKQTAKTSRTGVNDKILMLPRAAPGVAISFS